MTTAYQSSTTTTTIIAEFTNELNIRKFVFFLPISRRFQNEDDLEITKKNKATFNTGELCDIINAVGGKMSRGVSSGGNIFKNCISGYISGGENMIHYKISKKNILLAGKLSDFETANTIFDFIFDSIIEANESLDELTNTLAKKLLDWFEECFKGDKVTVFKNSSFIYDPREDTPTLISTKTLHQLIVPKPHLNLPRFWTNAITEVAYDCFSFEEAKGYVTSMLQKEPLYQKHFNIDNVRLSLEAHKHNLPFAVNMQNLHKKLYQKEGIYSTYINTIHDNVRVEMPYTICEENKNFVRKKKSGTKDFLIFLVYSSGYISYSGKLRELNEVGSNIFIDMLIELREFIEL